MAVNGNRNARNRQNAFSEWMGILTPQGLEQQRSIENRALRERRLAQIGPVNTMAMQFGEAIGGLIRQRRGILSPEEREAAQNGEVMAAAMDSALTRMRENKIPEGSIEAQQILIEETARHALRSGNLAVADQAFQKMQELEVRQAQLNKLKAETEDIGIDNELNRERFGFEREQANIRNRQTERGLEFEGERLRLDSERLALEMERLNEQRQNERRRIELAAGQGADALRGELDKQIAPAVEGLEAARGLEELAKQGTPASDVALIFKFLKILDPESTVREGEFETVQAAKEWILAHAEDGQVSQEAARQINRMVQGERFTDYQRAQLVNTARAFVRQNLMSAQDKIDAIMGIGARRGLPLEDIRSGNVNLINQGLEQMVPLGAQELESIKRGELGISDLLMSDDELNAAIGDL